MSLTKTTNEERPRENVMEAIKKRFDNKEITGGDIENMFKKGEITHFEWALLGLHGYPPEARECFLSPPPDMYKPIRKSE